jgi:hypothetical protein
MIKSKLFIVLFSISSTLHAQKDFNPSRAGEPDQDVTRGPDKTVVSIYPVPVRDNVFTIKSDKEISFIKVTNIIGQDIFKSRYNDPLTSATIPLDNPFRGMYLVTVVFSDGERIVKKILIEQTE